jgi:hypothetical protein
MNPKRSSQPAEERWLTIEEVRTVSDLRIMHAKVDELYHTVAGLKERYDEATIVKYADQPVLTRDIQRIDEIYLWFVRLKEESISQRNLQST